MIVATIGFTKKSAEEFFTLLKEGGVRTLVDIRLNPNSQLAGFAQGRDLPYLLRGLADVEYLHLPDLAPSKALLSRYREDGDWGAYERDFGTLLDSRSAARALEAVLGLEGPICLLCSEHGPEKCHRRLVAERLAREDASVEIIHLC